MVCAFLEDGRLERYQRKIHILNPKQVKNDWVDAFGIADHLRFGRIGKEVCMDDDRYKALQTLTRARVDVVQNLTREKQHFANYLFLKCSGMAQDRDIATTTATMERFETVDELAYVGMDELTAFIAKSGRGRFADPEAMDKAVQTAAKGSYRLPKTVNDSVNQAMSVAISTTWGVSKDFKRALRTCFLSYHTDANASSPKNIAQTGPPPETRWGDNLRVCP